MKDFIPERDALIRLSWWPSACGVFNSRVRAKRCPSGAATRSTSVAPGRRALPSSGHAQPHTWCLRAMCETPHHWLRHGHSGRRGWERGRGADPARGEVMNLLRSMGLRDERIALRHAVSVTTVGVPATCSTCKIFVKAFFGSEDDRPGSLGRAENRPPPFSKGNWARRLKASAHPEVNLSTSIRAASKKAPRAWAASTNRAATAGAGRIQLASDEPRRDAANPAMTAQPDWRRLSLKEAGGAPARVAWAAAISADGQRRYPAGKLPNDGAACGCCAWAWAELILSVQCRRGCALRRASSRAWAAIPCCSAADCRRRGVGKRL